MIKRTTHQMGVLELLHHRDTIQLDVEVLIYALERAAELDVVFELHCYFVVDEGFEKTGGGDELGMW